MEKEIGTIENKEKGNETLCPCGDILTVHEIGLIQFLESCYTRDCLNMTSVDIGETVQSVAFSLSVILSSCIFNTCF